MPRRDDLARVLSRYILPHAWLLAAPLLAVLPVLVLFSSFSLEDLFNDPERWVPPDSPERQTYEWFIEHFGTTDLVLVSWEGCTIDDPRLDRLAEALKPNEALGVDPRAELIDRVFTGRSVLSDLTAPPLKLSPRQALARVVGSLVGPDGITSCAVVVLTEPGIWRRAEALEFVQDTAQEVCQVPRETVIVAGPPVEGVVIDRATRDASNRLTLPSVAVSLVIGFLFLRSWKFIAVIIIVGSFGQALSLALVYWTGNGMNAVLIVMPPLIFVLTTSMGVHLVNYYKDALLVGNAASAPLRTLQLAWQPCLLAVGTTAIGIASLGASTTVPVRVFGMVATIALFVTSAVLVFLLVGTMEHWPSRPANRQPSARAASVASRFTWARWSELVTSLWGVIIAVSAILFLAGAWGLSYVATSVRLPELFPQNSRIMEDYRWLEDRIGPLVPLEVVLSFSEACPLRMVDRLALIHNLQEDLAAMDSLGATMSAATFLPALPRGGGPRSVMARSLYDGRLRQNRERLIEERYLAEDAGEHWRISARAWALRPLDYGRLVQEVRRQAEGNISRRHADVPGIEVTVTGVIPFIYTVQRTLLKDLVVSFSTAFASIALVLAIALRSAACGGLVMIPNLFPTVTLFGLLGWLGTPLDIGSIMTASVALGIAVDDTVHFVTWFRRGLVDGLSRREAVQSSFTHCGTAMVQTSLICGAGMLVYGLSDFVPASRFAWMMVILLAATLLGDLALLPALLASPAGRLFARRGAPTS